MTVTLPAYCYRLLDADFKAIKLDNCPIQHCKRVAQVILPFASLYSPLNRFISVSTDSINGVSCLASLIQSNDYQTTALLHCALASISIAGTVFKHPLSLAITTSHQLFLNSCTLWKSLGNGDPSLVLENSLLCVNNALYLVIIFYGSLELIAASIALQIIVEGYQSYQEFKNGDHILGYAHLLMGGIRFYQLQPLFNSLIVKWLVKADIEVWRDQLSPYESIVKELLGEEYLYFKKNDKREKFLILCAEEDAKGSFHPGLGSFTADVKNLSSRFDVKFLTISSVEDIGREIGRIVESEKITGLMIRAHGNHYSMKLGSDPKKGTLRQEVLHLVDFSKLAPICVIVLDSCETAKDPHTSIAYLIANQSQRVVFATDGILNAHSFADLKLSSIEPLEWQFKPNDPLHLRKICPEQQPQQNKPI